MCREGKVKPVLQLAVQREKHVFSLSFAHSCFLLHLFVRSFQLSGASLSRAPTEEAFSASCAEAASSLVFPISAGGAHFPGAPPGT